MQQRPLALPPGQPAPRCAAEALTDGVRLTLRHLHTVLGICLLAWAPGELVRLGVYLLPLSPQGRIAGSLVALGLTLLGIALGSAAVVGLLLRAGQAPVITRLDGAAGLSGRRLWELCAFGLLVATWMAPLGLASLASWTLLTARGQCLLAQGVGMVLSFLGMLQSQGAAVGLALLYADACAEGGIPTRLAHLARWR